ncbi:transposase, partial [Actinoplanes philippinensis]
MSSVTGVGAGHGEPGLILLDAWRRELYEGVLGSRSRTLFSLVDGLAVDQGRCGCPAHLSLGTVTGHAAAYRALRDGEIDTGRALRAACEIAARSGLPRVYAVDTTAWPRPNAPTSPDRQPQYTPGGPRGSALIKTGWRYQHVVRLTLTPDSWVVPVLSDRVASGDDLVQVTVDHIARVCAADGARPADR